MGNPVCCSLRHPPPLIAIFTTVCVVYAEFLDPCVIRLYMAESDKRKIKWRISILWRGLRSEHRRSWSVLWLEYAGIILLHKEVGGGGWSLFLASVLYPVSCIPYHVSVTWFLFSVSSILVLCILYPVIVSCVEVWIISWHFVLFSRECPNSWLQVNNIFFVLFISLLLRIATNAYIALLRCRFLFR